MNSRAWLFTSASSRSTVPTLFIIERACREGTPTAIPAESYPRYYRNKSLYCGVATKVTGLEMVESVNKYL